MKHKTLLIKVLVFGAIASVLTVALGIKLANSRLFAHTYVLQATFDDATGVLAGDSVKLAGVDVGRVTGAEIAHGQAIVSFNIDDDIELPTDSVVAIRWRNVLGQRFLYVYPGDDTESFAAGETIPVENTKDVRDFGQLLNKIGPVLKAIDPDEANAFLDAVNTALQGNEADVRQLLDDGARLVETLSAEDDTIRDLLTSADTVTAAFASQDDALGSIFDNLDDVGVVLRRRITDVNSLVTDFSVVQRELNDVLVENRSNIDSSISSLDTITSLLARKHKLLAETLHTLPLGVVSYQQTSSWGEFFNVRITKILFQDPDSNILVEQNESEQQHGDEGGTPAVGNGAGDGYGEDEQGDDTSEDAGSGGDNADRSDTPLSEGLEAILRFVLLGGLR